MIVGCYIVEIVVQLIFTTILYEGGIDLILQTLSNLGPKSLLRSRNVQLIGLAQFFSLFGDRIYQIALIWLSYQISGSSLMMGLVATATALPTLLFSLFSGFMADHMNKARLMMFADYARAVLVLAVPLAYQFDMLSIPLMIGVAFLMGTASQLFYPAFHSLIPGIVAKEDLLKTNSFFASIEQVMSILGPSIAAFLLFFVSEVNLFYLTCVTYVLSGILTGMVKGIQETANEESSNMFEYFGEAFRYIRQHEAVFTLILSGAVINLFLGGAITVATPLYADLILNAGESGYSLLISTMTFGMLCGSLGTNLLKNINRGKVFVMGFFGTGLSFVAVGAISNPYLAYALFFVFGFFVMIVNVNFNTMLQEMVPGNRLGIVMSIVMFVTLGLNPLSMGLTGFLGEYITPDRFYLACGIITLIVGVYALSKRSIRTAQ